MSKLNRVYKKSKDIIEHKIEDETVIIPVTSEVVDLENGIFFTLNETAKEIWQRIDGKKRALDIIKELENIYNIERNELINDTLRLLEELSERLLIIEK